MRSKWRLTNVDATSWRRIDVCTTSFRRHVSAGKEWKICDEWAGRINRFIFLALAHSRRSTDIWVLWPSKSSRRCWSGSRSEINLSGLGDIFLNRLHSTTLFLSWSQLTLEMHQSSAVEWSFYQQRQRMGNNNTTGTATANHYCSLLSSCYSLCIEISFSYHIWRTMVLWNTLFINTEYEVRFIM